MKTLVINLFGGPGSGKSTGAAYIFSQLKTKGFDCELVTEFAKDKVWEDNKEVFKNQFYITGKQSFKISRCNGKVNIIITDSPILLGAIYTDSEIFKAAVLEEFNKYNNINFFIKRQKDYNPNGRNQTEEEAKSIDVKIINYLKENKIDNFIAPGTISGYDFIVNYITILLADE